MRNLLRWNRRRFLRSSGWLGLLGVPPTANRLAAAPAARAGNDSSQVYRRLGLRPIINAAGTYTHLGGSLMPPEVVEAMLDAGRHYVPIRDLSRAVGERIAKLTGNEAVLVTTGAAGAIFVATCAAIAGDDPDKRKRLPFAGGMKNEVVCQNLHHTGWVRQCEAAGARMMDVVDAAARAGGVRPKDLIGRGQTRPLARARQLAMHLLREIHPGVSLHAVGYLLDRDHTTVLYGCRRAEALLARDRAFRELYERARRELASPGRRTTQAGQ